jgi:hypothetical protein
VARLRQWITDHQRLAVFGLLVSVVSLLIAAAALVRDVTNFQVGAATSAPTPSLQPGLTAPDTTPGLPMPESPGGTAAPGAAGSRSSSVPSGSGPIRSATPTAQSRTTTVPTTPLPAPAPAGVESTTVGVSNYADLDEVPMRIVSDPSGVNGLDLKLEQYGRVFPHGSAKFAKVGEKAPCPDTTAMTTAPFDLAPESSARLCVLTNRQHVVTVTVAYLESEHYRLAVAR